MKMPKIKNLSPTPLLIVLAVAVCILVPIRTFQLLNCVDSVTGFWEIKDFTVPLTYTLCILFIAAALTVSVLSGKMTTPQFKEGKDPFLAAGTIIFFISLIIDIALRISNLVVIFSELTASKAEKKSFLLLTSGVIPMTLETVAGIFSVIFFIFITVSAITGKNLYGKRKLLALSPVFWAMFRLIYHFIDPLNFRNASQLFLELTMLCFAMLFFLAFARISSDINKEKSMRLLWFSGTCAAFFAFLCALAPFILIITGKGEILSGHYPMRFCDLGLAFFILPLLFTVTPFTGETVTDMASTDESYENEDEVEEND